MKPTVLIPRLTMSWTSAWAMMSVFCVVLKAHFLSSVMGSTMDAAPTGASMGVPDSAANCSTLMELGEPVGPIRASTWFSLISFLNAVTVWVGSLASSRLIYSMLRSPAFGGSSGTVFFCGMPTSAVGPVAEVTTPILTCPSTIGELLNNAAPSTMVKRGKRTGMSPVRVGTILRISGHFGMKSWSPDIEAKMAMICHLRHAHRR